MGSYHSYVGDAKLEDSKDNWYRISGLSVNRVNFLVDHGGWNTTKRIPHHGDSLENNIIGYYLSSNNIVSDGYAKICSNFNSVPVAINLLAMVPVFGNAFNIKDRDIDVNTLNFPMTHNYNGNIGKSVRRVLVNTVADELWCADIVGNTGGCYTYASSVINTNSSFRPMLTLKPVGEGVIEHFTLKIKIIRRFTQHTNPRPYRISFAQEIIEGNSSIIKETICRFGIGRNGTDLPDGQLSMPRATADSYVDTLEPGELIAHRGPHGAANPAGDIGILYKLINGKYLYISKLHSLPGMEQPWPDNGGITTIVVTFTEADAYAI